METRIGREVAPTTTVFDELAISLDAVNEAKQILNSCNEATGPTNLLSPPEDIGAADPTIILRDIEHIKGYGTSLHARYVNDECSEVLLNVSKTNPYNSNVYSQTFLAHKEQGKVFLLIEDGADRRTVELDESEAFDLLIDIRSCRVASFA